MKYEIIKSFWYKGYVQLLSVVGPAAWWSVHKCETRQPMDIYKSLFQQEHDRQVDFLMLQEQLNEPAEFRTETVDDKTEESKTILHN